MWKTHYKIQTKICESRLLSTSLGLQCQGLQVAFHATFCKMYQHVLTFVFTFFYIKVKVFFLNFKNLAKIMNYFQKLDFCVLENICLLWEFVTCQLVITVGHPESSVDQYWLRFFPENFPIEFGNIKISGGGK